MSCNICWGMANAFLQKADERRYTDHARKWALKFLEEAVPGGDVCHFPEQHRRETTSNDEQPS